MSEQLIPNDVVGSGGGCFPAGAQVLIENGKTVAIESLRVGDTVLSFDERGDVHRAKVTKTHYHADPQPVIHVRHWNGHISLTPNHWVLNQYGAFVEVGTLGVEDALVDQLGHLRPIIEKNFEGRHPVYNLTVEPHHTFICDGVRVHNGGHRQRHPLIVEDIQGAGGGGGGGKGGGGGRTPILSADNAASKQMVSILDALGEGAIGGLVDGAKSIFFADVPLQNQDGTYNYQGVQWEQRLGTQDQEIIPGFASVETPRRIGVRVKQNQPATITVTNPNADRVRVIVLFPSLRAQDATNGDVYGTTVNFHFDIAEGNGPYETVTYGVASRKSSSRWQQEYVLTLPKPFFDNDGPESQNLSWRIRMVRDTSDSNSDTLNNETYLDSIVEIVDTKLRYPNTALIGLKVDSSYFAPNTTRGYLVDGLFIKIPSNYDPVKRAYDGIWDGTYKLAVSSNPAWILFDVLTNKRYGLGQYIAPAMVDTTELYQIGRYCDELVPDGRGGMEPRFEINTQIRSRVDAMRLVSDISSAMRGMIYWAGSMARFTQDRPREPSMRFTPANVVGGQFTRSGSSRADRHSVVCVTWNDPAQSYKQVIEYVEDRELIEKFGIRQLGVVAFGCTSRGQAYRVGKWILYTERYEPNLTSFKVGLDSANVLPGDVAEIHEPVLAGRSMGGRLRDCTLNVADLDREIEITSFGSAKIAIRMPDGEFATRFIDNKPGKTTRITWASDLPDVPLRGAIYVVSEETLQAQLVKIVGIKQGESASEFEIAVLDHNESKFDAIEKGLTLSDPIVSTLDTRRVNTPSDFRVEELTIETAPGVVGMSLDLSWFSASAQSYEIRWRRMGEYATNWKTEFSGYPGIRLDNVRAGQHEFHIVAINGFGVRSKPLLTNYTTQGKTAAPGDVPNFKVKKRTNDLVITWDEVTDIRVSGYEVRVGPDWEGAQIVTENFQGTMITHDQSEAGTYHYHIRSVNAQGTYSDNVSTFELVLKAPQTVKNLNIIQSGTRLEIHWDSNPETDVVYYEVREGDAWPTGTLLSQVKATTLTSPAGSIGLRKFWVKAVSSPGIYSDEAAFITNQVAMLPDRNIVFTADEAAMGWLGHMVGMHRVGNDIMMDNGVSRGEYFFDVDLLSRYRCANSLYPQLSSIVQDSDSMTWDTSLFTWDDNEALRHWAPSGDIDSVIGRYQIATETGLRQGDIEGWRLNGNLVAVSGQNGATEQGAALTFGTGRYGDGLVLKSGQGAVTWDGIQFPATFSYSFWMTPQTVSKGEFERPVIEISGTDGKFLQVIYNDASESLVMTSDVGERLDVRAPWKQGGPILVTISQSGTERKFFAAQLGAESIYEASGAYAPRGSFDTVALNWIG
ncbi:phage tail protein [Castellaniella sp.]|uniref:TipJ family phage tail tip protein n=1 Tax=Castellaniella sp. TaxID=1955812 RepID=UPI002AFDF377|nr:phage tail protein [Castellaniella sp.]